MGWGAYFQFGKGNDQWTDKEKDLHINNLELLFLLTLSCLREISWVSMLELRVTVQLNLPT